MFGRKHYLPEGLNLYTISSESASQTDRVCLNLESRLERVCMNLVAENDHLLVIHIKESMITMQWKVVTMMEVSCGCTICK